VGSEASGERRGMQQISAVRPSVSLPCDVWLGGFGLSPQFALPCGFLQCLWCTGGRLRLCRPACMCPVDSGGCVGHAEAGRGPAAHAGGV